MADFGKAKPVSLFGSVFFVVVKTLVEDEELKALRATADGSKPFEVIGLWERLGEQDWSELKKLPARERLALGYYMAGKRRAEQMRERA